MLQDFDFLVTTSRGNEEDACSELEYLLREIGSPEPDTDQTGISGVIVAKTGENPIETVGKLRRILHESPYQFRYTLRIIPIEKVVDTDLDKIQQATSRLTFKIRENETFRVTVEKRFTELHRREIIEAVATNVKREVDLTEPDKILLIEVVGELTGISVIKNEDIISVIKEKIR